MRSLLLVFLVACSAAPEPTLAPPPEPDFHARIDALAQPMVAGEWVAGLVVGVLHDGVTEFYGYGRVRDGGSERPDAHTVYEIGSVTKVFTSLLLADMSEHGLVALDQPVASLLPLDVALTAFDGARVTLADLATHTSGLARMPDDFAPADPRNPYADYDSERLLAYLARAKLVSPPGTKYDYSNLGVGLLGHVLAARAGQSYGELVRARITEPLAMSETAIALAPELAARFAQGHDAEGGATPAWDLTGLAGAGALRSTAADMLRFVGANLDAGNPLASAMATTHAARKDADQGSVGLGWHIGAGTPSLAGVRWHNGGTGGFHSFVAFDPERRLGLVVLASSSAQVVDPLGAALLLMLRGEPYAFQLPGVAAVAPALLERYTGAYAIVPQFVLTVTREDDKLFVHASGQPRFRVYPESETIFNYRVAEAQIRFQVDPDGKVPSLTLVQGGMEQVARRVP